MLRLRHILFAEKLGPSATADVDALRREIDDAKFELSDPSKDKRKRRMSQRISEAQRELIQTVKDRDAIRAVLWPDDEPEE